MKCDKTTMLLYAVTDRAWEGEQTLYQQVEQALKGGVTCLQLREKNLDKALFLEEAKQLKKLCGQFQIPFIINDDVDIAIACKADGIHVGQDDMEVQKVRQRVGQDMIIGVSVHNLDEAIKAVKNGADYLGIGAIHATATKEDADVVSYEDLKQICHSVNLPTVAIGGIKKENILELTDSGVDGIAVVSAIFAEKEIEKSCQILFELSKQMVNNNLIN